jgi:hypothetical protein
MAKKPASIKGAAAKLGVEVVGETIEGVFGLASATVTAAGEAAKGVGMAVGGALQGALSPAPITIINSIGMTGGAGKARVTGGGTIPAAPKKSAKPAVNSKMATEKLLVVAVNYLSSIEKTLVDQLNFERIAAQQQAQAQRENAIESGGKESPYKSLGEKFGALKDAATDKVATATKVILGGAALASLGLLGLGQLDTSELDRLKQNWKEFQDNIEPILAVVRKVQEFIGDDATLGAAIGYSILGLKGGIIGLIAGLVYDLTGSAALAAAAGGTSALLAYSKNARALVGKGAQAAGRSAYNLAGKGVVELMTNPAARMATGMFGAAVAATGTILYGIDQMFKYTAGSAINAVEKYEQSYGLFVQEVKNEGGGVLSRVKYKIKINDRKINYFNVPRKEIEGRGHNEKERFYYWNQVHLAATEGRFGSGPAAAKWLQKQGPAWLDKRFPRKANATRVPARTATPDATKKSGSPATPAMRPTLDPPRIKTPSETGLPEEAMAFFESKGWTKEQAAGIVGNLMVESGLVTTAEGDGGDAYGIAQWNKKTSPDRISNFQKVMGKSLYESNFQEQLEFVNWELNNSEKAAGDALRATSSATDAAAIVDDQYERSAGTMLAQRQANAAALAEGDFKNLQGGGGGGDSTVLSNLMDLTKGAMEAIGIIARATFGKQKPQSGSQLGGFNSNMQGNVSAASAASNQEGTAAIAALNSISTKIQQAADFGAGEKTQAETKQQSAGLASGGKTSFSNDNKRAHFDPNFPGKGSLETYMQYHNPTMAASLVTV